MTSQTKQQATPLNANDLVHVVAIIKLVKSHFNKFDPVILDVSYDKVDRLEKTIESFEENYRKNPIAALGREDLLDINSLILALEANFSSYGSELSISSDDLSDLEEKIANLT